MRLRYRIGRSLFFQVIIVVLALLPTWLLLIFTGAPPWDATGAVGEKAASVYQHAQAVLLLICAVVTLVLWSQVLFPEDESKAGDDVEQGASTKGGPGPTPKP